MRVIFNKKMVLFLCVVFFQWTTSSSVTAKEPVTGLSFCIVDLKFNEDKLKICEFGQGVFSTFRGYDSLYGQGALWAQVWNYVAQFNKPIWFVSPKLNDKNIKDIAGDVLEKFGGKAYSSLLELKRDVLFKQMAAQKMTKHNKNKIDDFSAIVFVRKDIQNLKNFIKIHPSILVVDEKSGWFVGNKYLTHSLFQNDTELMNYRPNCLVCTKRLSTKKTNQILHELSSDYCVIKPINASMGRGIVIVERDDLLKALGRIFQQETNSESADESSYNYWEKDRNEIFLIEEYAQSKKVYMDGKWYDPTMRVAFIVVVENGKIQIKFLDAYWKLPEKDLDAQGSFTERHKSHVAKKGKSSCVVAVGDFKKVKTILEGVLLKLFYKMHTIDVIGN